MKTTLILLLAIVGQSHALQEGLEYVFLYKGVVQGGLPSIRHQYAVEAIKFVITLQVKNNGRAAVQFSNIETAELHGDVGCDPRNPPLQYRPLVKELEVEMTLPFEVDLKDCFEDCLRVTGTEKLWLVNFRKGVISFFRNEILQGNFQAQAGTVSELFHSGDAPPAFSVMEDTIHGRCRVDYTIHKMPALVSHSHYFSQAILQDVQFPELEAEALTTKGKKTPGKKFTPKTPTKTPIKGAPDKLKAGVPKLDKQLWHVVKSIDFDDCEDKVYIQRTPVGVHSSMAAGQNKWLQSRSSVSEYILRGKGGAFRIETASTEGALLVSPFGIGDELVHSTTNQTVHLVTVREISKPTDTSSCSQKVATPMHEFLTGAPPPGMDRYYKWVQYAAKGSHVTLMETLTGEEMSTAEEELTTDSVVEIIKTIASLLNEKTLLDSKLPVTHQMILLLYYIRDLPKVRLEHVFKQIFSRKDDTEQILLIDLAMASGSVPATEVVLERAKSGHIPNDHVASLFMTMTSNIRDSSVLYTIGEFVQSVNLEENPLMASTVYINYANLLKKFCVDIWAHNIFYEGPTLGDHSCKGGEILPQFLNFLENKYKSTTKTWVKDVVVQTVSSLGSPLGLPFLGSVVRDRVATKTNTRTIAVYALSRWQMPPNYRKQVMTFLMEVFSDRGEEAQVRKAALEMLTSWGPKANLWTRLARLSWREPSRTMASLIYATIDAVAGFSEEELFRESAKAASHALNLARPVAPSIRYSSVVWKHMRLVNDHLECVRNVAWFSDSGSPMMKEYYTFIMSVMGGFHFINLEFAAMQQGLREAHFNMWSDMIRSEKYDVPSIAQRIAKDFFSKIEESIQWEKGQKSPELNLLLYLKIFNDMMVLLPLSPETLHHFIDPSTIAAETMSLMLGKYSVFAKFLNPIDNSVVMPTDMGVPAIIAVASPVFYHIDAEYQSSFGSGSFSLDAMSKINFSSDIAVKVDFSGLSEVDALVPWKAKYVGALVFCSKRLDLPAKYGVTLSSSEMDRSLSFSFAFHQMQSIPVIQASTFPMTISGLVHTTTLYTEYTVKPVVSKGTKTRVLDLPSDLLDIRGKVTWTSEYPFPLNLKNLKHLLKNPVLRYAFLTSPTVRMWDLKVEVFPEKSATKNLTAAVDCKMYEKQTEEIKQYGQEEEEFSQVGTDFGQYDDEQSVQGQLVQQPFDQKAEKLQTLYGGSLAKTCEVKLLAAGKEQRSLDLFLSWSAPAIFEGRKSTKGQIAVTRGPIPGVGVGPDSETVCFDWRQSSPVFSELDVLDSMLSREDLDTHISLDMTGGCQGEPLANLKWAFRISPERMEQLKETLTKECDFDPYDPTLSFHKEAKMDKMEFEMTWKKISEVSKERFPVVYLWAQQNIKLLSRVFPGFSCSDAKGLTVTGARSLETDKWQIEAKSGDFSFSVPMAIDTSFLDDYFTVGGVAEPATHSRMLLFNGGLSTKCFVKTNFVRTFDGFSYDYTPSPCYVVAALDCVHHSWVILTKEGGTKSEIPEVRFIDLLKHLVIDIGKEIRVNGKPIKVTEKEHVKDNAGKLLCILRKSDKNHVMVVVPNVGTILVKTHVEIQLEVQWVSNTCGMCGNFNGEEKDAPVGPKGCVFRNLDTFAAAWTASSDTCDPYVLLERREAADNFQKSCLKIGDLAKEYSSSAACINTEYMNYDYEGRKCISSSPVVSCKTGCVPFGNSTEQVEFRCVHGSQPMSPVKPLKGYLLIPSKEEKGGSVLHVPLNVPTFCRRPKVLSQP